MPLTRDQVIAVLGPVDDVVVAQVIGMGVSEDDLIKAQAWIAAEEALINEGRPFPSGRVGQLVRLLARIEEEERAAWENAGT
jgi:hypothetical protein